MSTDGGGDIQRPSAPVFYQCEVCNRRTYITTAGVVALHHDMGGRRYCPLSGQEVNTDPNLKETK